MAMAEISRVLCMIPFIVIVSVWPFAHAKAEPPAEWQGVRGWWSADIGTTGGSAVQNGDTFEITGDGHDIWGSSDGFHFMFKELTGNGSIMARVVSNGTGSNTWAKGGVMIRDDLSPGSAHGMIVVTGGDGGGAAFHWRGSPNAATNSAHNPKPTVSPPYWVRIERWGNELSGFLSADGRNWRQQGTTQTVNMIDPVYIGLCVTSHDEGTLRTFTFDNISYDGCVKDRPLNFVASRPVPADGTICTNTWVNLSWTPGELAALHHVYFSTDPDAVAQRDSSTLIAATDDPSIMIGLPGYALPNGLQMGTTYYWCVDEVNDYESDSPWRGDVWNFWVPREPVVYLLITNRELALAFQVLVDRRTSQGFPGKLITLEDICKHYPGVDEQEQIRNCIIDYYRNHGLLYVALGGDETVMPIRYSSPRSPEENVPVDLYYADTDGGNWDVNANGVYGEVGDVSETELTPEVHLGRIPVGTVEETAAYVSKVVTYETAPLEGFANSMICFGNTDGLASGSGRWLGYSHHDPVSQSERHHMWEYDKYIQPYWQAVPFGFLWDAYSSWDTVSCGDYALTLDHLSDRLNESYHFIFYYGHASAGAWGMLEGRRFTSSHAAALTNSIPSIVVSEACSPAGFDEGEPCLSEAFLRNPNGGAVAFFGHVRGATAPNATVERLFIAMFRDHAMTTGEAMTNVMTALASSRVNDPLQIYRQYNLVLHGDPCIQFLREESGRHIQIFRPKGCEVIQQNSDIIVRWNAAGTGFKSYETVKLEYSADSGMTWHLIQGAQSLRYNGCAFTWRNCPLTTGSHYRIRVSSLADPSVTDMSGRDFTIADLCFLTVQSIPDANLVITGSYDNGVTTYDLVTDYDISVPKGTTVSLNAPWYSEDKPELVFAQWKDDRGSTLTDVPEYTFVVSHDMTIVAEYGESVERRYYVNDEIPEYDIGAGDDDNDGRSPVRPMRHIQALLTKYPGLGESIVTVSAGVYEENIRLNAANTGLQLVGAGRDLTTIDGNQKGPCLSLNGLTKSVISGLTMRNGSGTCGGGIWCIGSSVTIRDCAFVENATEGAGGAIYVDIGSYVEVSESAFSHNSGHTGGAIYNRGTAQIHQCSFQADEAARYGGAIHIQSGSQLTRIVDCTFVGNTSPEYGGGIFGQGSSVCEIKRCVFQNNSSMFGGALSNFGSTAIIDSCLFEANHVNRDGGAVYHKHECTATFVNCIFSDNEGGRLGGALTISTEPSDISVINCTFNGNRANNPGGALYATGTLTATAANCIFWGNTPDQITGEVAITYCDVQGGWQGQGNINVDPLFADAASGDYHLKSWAGRWLASTPYGWVTDNVTSPCIDTGDPSSPLGDEPEPNGGRINMGAYGGTAEASKSP